MAGNIQELLDGKIDFIGQQLVEQLMHYVLIMATALSFVAGFAMQSLRVTFGMLGTCTIVLVLTIVPGWGLYRRDGVEWRGGSAGVGK